MHQPSRSSLMNAVQGQADCAHAAPELWREHGFALKGREMAIVLLLIVAASVITRAFGW